MKLQWMFKGRNFLLLTAAAFAIGCQTKPVANSGSFQKARWESIAQINDLKKNKNQRLSIDILAVKNEKIRMEVSATLGYQVASILLNREGFKAVIYPQKKFYQGAAHERSIWQTLHVPVTPKALFAVMFDEPINGNNWVCEKNQNGLPELCVQRQMQIKVEWVRNENGTKVVKISSPNVDISWYFKNPEINFLEKPEMFILNAPQGYQTVSANR